MFRLAGAATRRHDMTELGLAAAIASWLSWGAFGAASSLPQPLRFDYEVVAAIGEAGILDIEREVSVNESGVIAFVGVVDIGGLDVRHIFSATPGAGLLDISPSLDGANNEAFDPRVQINDSGKVMVRRVEFVPTPFGPAPVSYLETWDAQSPDLRQTLVYGELLFGEFDGLYSHPSLSNVGSLAFAALNGGSNFLGTITPEGNFTVQLVSPLPKPMMADTNRFVFRLGTTRIVYLPPAFFPFEYDSGSQFASVGEQPGVNDAGNFITFVGTDIKSGRPGIWCLTKLGSQWIGPFRVAGQSGDGSLDPGEVFADLVGDPGRPSGRFEPGDIDHGPFSSFIADRRVGAADAPWFGQSARLIAFLASGTDGSKGLYATTMSTSESFDECTTSLFGPSFVHQLVLRVGQTVPGLPGTIEDLDVYDPLSDEGHIAVWVRTTATTAVVRVSATRDLDSDGDGLLDGWELPGGGLDIDADGQVDLDLAALGATVGRKDLFVEVDAQPGWAIPAESMQAVIDAFDGAPVPNPGRRTGVNLVVQDGGDSIDPPPGCWACDADTTGDGNPDFPGHFAGQRRLHFGTPAERANANATAILAAKRLTYRYCIAGDFLRSGTDCAATASGAKLGGIGQIGGANFIVAPGEVITALNGADTGTPAQYWASAFMHELGHTLGLDHGGGEPENFKPNYYSVMNYLWAGPRRFKAICGADAPLLWCLTYSDGTTPPVDETMLLESEDLGAASPLIPDGAAAIAVAAPSVGGQAMSCIAIRGGSLPPIATLCPPSSACRFADWDADFIYEPGVPSAADVNRRSASEDPGPMTTLTDHNDWGALQYRPRLGCSTAAEEPSSSPSTEYSLADELYYASIAGLVCVGDLDRSGTVDGADLAMVLGSWGACPRCVADINGDGVVDGADLSPVLGTWGPCP